MQGACSRRQRPRPGAELGTALCSQVAPPSLYAIPVRAKHCAGWRRNAFVPGPGNPRRPLRVQAHCSASPGSRQVRAARGIRTCHRGGWGAGTRGRRQGRSRHLKRWWSAGGGLLHLTVLLSLGVLRVDLDLYLLLPPPPTLLRDELLLLGRPASSAYALSPLSASGGWGRAGWLHPKGRDLDPAAPPEGQLLREVRALGVPFIPRTRVDAWLVHSVAAGDADEVHGRFDAAAASSAGGAGANLDGGGQAVQGGGGDPRAARSTRGTDGSEVGAERDASEVRRLRRREPPRLPLSVAGSQTLLL
ncbi:hypothetical protein P7K49_025198 [Saguinus oedipus]|uniref:Uncharacterized protein n=1 Tax=Saguinus oedipus TaxID=9490 RepID=A0ABQ9UGF1_SAGOE|nr:hypothetical protein P7K49_025198 [Saguinus oedipus]